ncbi:MAG: hypothetical protein IJ863_08395 [Spirochaetales bacterium]|nr:hypothetical protein [Spirochaetales bacterium]
MAEKERSKLSRRIDEICRVVFLTEEGKPKSTTLVYSFSLALLFIAVTLISYMLLVDPIEKGLARSPVRVRQVLEYLVPGLVATVLDTALSFAFRKRERMGLVAAAYTWVDIVVLMMVITMMFTVDGTDWATEYGLFMAVSGIPMLVSAVLGTVASQVVYRRRKASYDRRMKSYASRPTIG